MTDRFEQQSQSLVHYAEPPKEPLLARSLKETDTSASQIVHRKNQKLKPSEAQNAAPDRQA